MTKSEFAQELAVLKRMIDGALALGEKAPAAVPPPAPGLPAVTLLDLSDSEDQYDVLQEIDCKLWQLIQRVLGGAP